MKEIAIDRDRSRWEREYTAEAARGRQRELLRALPAEARKIRVSDRWFLKITVKR
jgi:hypothetical protein